MAAVWFLRLTSGANTWASSTGNTAVVTVASTLTATGRHGARVAATVSVASSLTATGQSLTGYIDGGGAIESSTTGGIVSGTATLQCASTITATGRHGARRAIAITVTASVSVSSASGAYPDVPQVTGTVRQAVSGKVVSRGRAGKPRFRNYYPRTRHIFSVVHECDGTSKAALEAHYTSDRMRAFDFRFASDDQLYTVLYGGTPRFVPIQGDDYWRVEATLIEQ